jgi:hypothetical protein
LFFKKKLDRKDSNKRYWAYLIEMAADLMSKKSQMAGPNFGWVGNTSMGQF